MDVGLRVSYGIAAACLCVGLACAVRTRWVERARVGRVIEREVGGRAARAARVAGVVVIAAAAVGAVIGRDQAGVGWTLPLLALALAVHLCAPRGEDRVCGSDGVRRGWSVRRYEELEEWRLTGDHLRFRLRGRWEAVPCGAERQTAVRAALRAKAPGRESAFR